MNGEILGHCVVGRGPVKAIVLHDWIGDSRTWDTVLPYFDGEQMCWAVTDLRGYGRSRRIAGDFTLKEAVADVLAVAKTLGWHRYSVIGHSMSSLVAMSLGHVAAEQIERLVLVSPCPPNGTGADQQTVQFLRALARSNHEQAFAGLAELWGPRLSVQWIDYKARRWLEAADRKAAETYVDMFASHGLPEFEQRISMPTLAITGEQDAPFMRASAVCQSYSSLCSHLQVVPLEGVGHYPMQEAPPLTYTLIERFLAGCGQA